MLRLKDGRGRPLLLEDPTKAFGKPKFKKPETKFLHPGELHAFRATAATRAAGEAVAVELFVDTMLRVSELVNADVADLAGPDSTGRYSIEVKLKGGVRKAMPLSPEVYRQLRAYLNGRGELQLAAPLLADRYGQRWRRTGLTQVVGRIAKQAGVTRFSVSAHKLRHTAASVALAAGVNPLAVSKLLNHSSLRTTESYLHLVPGALAEARDLARVGLVAYTARAAEPARV